MKRVFILVVIALLTLGLVGTSGCSKKVTREADVSVGDYYTEAEFTKLSKDQRDLYCADLAGELERLESAQAAAANTDRTEDVDRLRGELTRMQTQLRAQGGDIQQIRDEISHFESLPTSYSVMRGDCLWSISGDEEIYADPVKWPRLYRANRDQISDPNLIYPDQVLAVPRDWPRQHMVVKGEWLSKIAGYWEIYDNYREWPRLYEANRDQIQDPDLIYPDQVLDIPR